MDKESDFPTSKEEMIAKLLEAFENMDPDARLACEKMIYWMAENPKEWEQFTNADFLKMVEEVRLENIRRRLGGKVGKILEFKTPI